MKHIGIAAVTAEGAAITYKYICSESEKILAKFTHPEISRGGTELPLLIDFKMTSLDILDSTTILGDAAIQAAIV